MDTETIREYCLVKPGVTEGFPFGETTLVFRVMEKIFLLLSLDQQPVRFNAKCNPDKAIELREQYAAIQPGYHMNKKHWNTVIIDSSITSALIREIIDDSYQLVIASLPAKLKNSLQ